MRRGDGQTDRLLGTRRGDTGEMGCYGRDNSEVEKSSQKRESKSWKSKSGPELKYHHE